MRKSTAIILTLSMLILGIAGGWLGHDYYQSLQTQTIEDTEQGQADDTESASSDEVSFTNIYRGAGTRNSYMENPSKPVVLLIDSQTELDALWPVMFTGELPPPKPTIDFDKQTILVSMLSQKETNGYLGTIKNITPKHNSLSVEIDDKSPGNACRTDAIVTRPIHVVAISNIQTENIQIDLTFSSAAPCALPL